MEFFNEEILAPQAILKYMENNFHIPKNIFTNLKNAQNI